MGQEIIKNIIQNKNFIFVGGFEHKKHPHINKKFSDVTDIKCDKIVSTNSNNIIKGSDVIIDFTIPQSTLLNIKQASLLRTAYVIGTTGINEKQEKIIKKLSKKIPILMSSNMSLGVNLLFNLVEQTASILKDSEYDIEIAETHHKHKIDSPSGTALSLGNFAAKGRKTKLKKVMVLDRISKNIIRKKGDIGFAVSRGGEIAGEHTVSFVGASDRIDIIHKANDRSIFVKGAIEAAIFLTKKKIGFFNMNDLILK